MNGIAAERLADSGQGQRQRIHWCSQHSTLRTKPSLIGLQNLVVLLIRFFRGVRFPILKLYSLVYSV